MNNCVFWKSDKCLNPNCQWKNSVGGCDLHESSSYTYMTDSTVELSSTTTTYAGKDELEEYKKKMDIELKTIKRNIRLNCKTNLIAGVNSK